jgi:ATP-dependent Zn protease
MAASFDAARKAAPAILFIDELDSFYSRQGDTRHRDWWANVVNGLLQLLDGVEKRDGVVVVGATNHPELVDPAIVRSGRLDRVLEIGLPDETALADILRIHLRDDLAHIDLMLVAVQATGATGADAERWVRGARRRARRAARTMIIGDLVAEIVGTEQRSPEHLRRVAVHEAGHAVLLAIKEPGRLRHVSIMGRADAHGEIALKPGEGILDETTIEGILCRMLAGRAAEQLVLGRVSSGAGGPDQSDLGRATALSLAAETALGFSRRPLLWRGVWNGNAAAQVLLANPALAEDVNARLEAAGEDACRTLQAHRGVLDEVVERLLARGVLSGAEVEDVLATRLVRAGLEIP